MERNKKNTKQSISTVVKDKMPENKKSVYYDIIVAGGGASGLFAAVCTADMFKEEGIKKSILIIEKKELPAKKIYATGNGKCNYTNSRQNILCYRGKNPEFAFNVYKKFDYLKTIEYFKKLGIYPKEKNGYYYPNSGQASSVAYALTNALDRFKVKINVNEKIKEIKNIAEVKNIKNDKCRFKINTDKNEYECETIIMCMGGSASPVYGTNGDGYYMLKKLSHHIIKPLPALCQLKAEGFDFVSAAGVRIEAKGTIYYNKGKENIIAAFERGEYLFTNYGISGIPVFQVSRYAAELIDKGIDVYMSLDLFEELSSEELLKELLFRFGNLGLSAQTAMNGLINLKLSEILLKMAKIDADMPAEKVSFNKIKHLADIIKNLSFKIISDNGFENAQTTAGGVNTSEINAEEMQSKLVPGLYFAGEIVDVDGACGGYNLQWAWSSAYTAAKAIVNYYKEQKNITAVED